MGMNTVTDFAAIAPEPLGETLKVPEGTKLACITNKKLFQDPALDPDEYTFSIADANDQRRTAYAQLAAESRAIAKCEECPLLQKCGEWSTTKHVSGVVAGKAYRDRHEPTLIDKYILGEEPTRQELIALWLFEDHTLTWMAHRLNLSVNTIARERDKILTPPEPLTPEEQYAAIRDRYSEASAAMYRLLANSVTPVERSIVMNTLVENTPLEDALRSAPTDRNYRSEEFKIRRGARTYAKNLLRSALRDEKIAAIDVDGVAHYRIVEEAFRLAWVTPDGAADSVEDPVHHTAA